MKSPIVLLSSVLTLLLFIYCKSNTQKGEVIKEVPLHMETNMKTMDTPQKKSTFVLVHSAWLGAWQWGHVTPELEKTGATVIAPDLPGHGADKIAPKDISMQNYVDSLVALLDQQKESVILVGHSFNGITISRVAELCPDKVAKLVYISAFLLPNGGSFFKAVEGSKAMENFYPSEDKTYALVNEEEIQNAFAHDISKEVFAEAAANIVPEPAALWPMNSKLVTNIMAKYPNIILNVQKIVPFPLLFRGPCIKTK
jgi:pimeloyl-ACP methyl ester carboxylesterase